MENIHFELRPSPKIPCRSRRTTSSKRSDRSRSKVETELLLQQKLACDKISAEFYENELTCKIEDELGTRIRANLQQPSDRAYNHQKYWNSPQERQLEKAEEVGAGVKTLHGRWRIPHQRITKQRIPRHDPSTCGPLGSVRAKKKDLTKELRILIDRD